MAASTCIQDQGQTETSNRSRWQLPPIVQEILGIVVTVALTNLFKNVPFMMHSIII